MPSRTLTPDPPDLAGSPAQRIPPDLPDVPGQLVPAESPAFSELRLVTVPAGWPPYDCETHGAACPLARAAPTLEPHVSRAPEGARAADTTTARTAVPPGAAAQGATSQAAAREAVALSRQYAQAIVEILAGSRPLRQTIGWTTNRVRAQIGDLARVLASDQRPRIKRIVASQPAASVVEMTVVINFGGRSRGLAMRFEQMPARRPAPGLPGRPARWFCTELETG